MTRTGPNKTDIGELHGWSFEAIGTSWWIGTGQPLSNATKQAVWGRIEFFDRAYSRFRDDWLVTQLQRGGSVKFPDDALPLLRFYRQLYDISGGAVTPLVGQLLSDAGYDAEYSLQPGPLRDVPAWDDVLSIDGLTVTASQPVILDFGAAGKGYLADLVGVLLQERGIDVYCIDASGDIICRGLDQPLTIGLENPQDSSQAIGTIELQGGALCGSAGQRRAWAGLNHIMNPHTKSSDTDIAAVWVRADSGILADGLATALYFTKPSKLLRNFSFEYLLLYANNTVMISPNFSADLFTA